MVKKRRKGEAFDPYLFAKERLLNETGAVVKREGARVNIALVYPNLYEVGMSNLGFQKIYHLANLRDDTVCERFFLPPAGGNSVKLVSIERQRELGDFDVIAFSVTFESDYINVLKILKQGGIPIKERGERDPLVVAGGVAVTMNPEPLAPFLDIVFIGEGEMIVDKFCDELVFSTRGKDLLRFASIQGAYIPSFYTPVYKDDGGIERFDIQDGAPKKVKRVWDEEYGGAPNRNWIDTKDTVFGDMALVEMGKGCGKHCRFCAAGYVYRPTRHYERKALFKAVDEAIDRIGKVGLVGSAVADHPDAEEVFEHIVSRGAKLSVSSLRLDMLSDNMLDLLKKGDCKTITVAPEAGTERLRKMVNKNLPDDLILNTVKRISEAGAFNVKLYFIVGLPGETDDDVKGIVDLATRIRAVMEPAWKKRGKSSAITIGVDGFIPKPATPYQWEPFEGIKPVSEKLNFLARSLRSIQGVSVHIGSARQGYFQTLLSVGDRRVSEILEKAAEFDGDLSRAIREADIDTDAIVTRRKDMSETMPWSLIEHGIHDGYLEIEYKKGIKGKVTDPCPDPEEVCRRCGEFQGVCTPLKTPELM